jgi:hypothetical protein
MSGKTHCRHQKWACFLHTISLEDKGARENFAQQLTITGADDLPELQTSASDSCSYKVPCSQHYCTAKP